MQLPAAKNLPVTQELVNFKDGKCCTFIVPVPAYMELEQSKEQIDHYVVSKAMHELTKFLISEDMLECNQNYDIAKQENKHSFRVWVTKPPHMRG